LQKVFLYNMVFQAIAMINKRIHRMNKWIIPVKAMALSISLLIAPACNDNRSSLPKLPGVEGPSFNIVDGKFVVTVKFLRLNIPGGAGGIPIPRSRYSTVSVSPNVLDGGSMLELTIDPEDIKGVEVADDPNTLPDGRPLPGIPGGILPSLRLDVEKAWNTSFYYHPKLFGFFTPIKVKFDTVLDPSYRIVIHGIDIGLLGWVGPNSEGGGTGLMLFIRPDDIKKLIEMKDRNPHLN
jgi:hypothetical protein